MLELTQILRPTAASAATSLRYFYDDVGRLARIVDSTGNIVTYTYDASGNILSTTRTVAPPSTTLSVFSVNPAQGLAGTQVTIQGQAFSSVATQNTVLFNGVAATVISASTAQLVVIVPPHATSGPLTVTVNGATAQAGNFTIQRTLVSLAVSPLTSSIALGRKQQFAATGTYSDGSVQVITSTVLWSSSLPTVASIGGGNNSATPGLATSAGVGTTTISATLGSVSGSTSLTVTAAVLVSIAITPSSPTVGAGSTLQLIATGTFSDLSTSNVSAQVTWTSSNPAVATVSNTVGTQGLVTGVAAGTTTITAASGTVSGAVLLTVNPSATAQVGRFLYVANDAAGLSAYSLTATTGQLRALSASGSTYYAAPAITGSFLYAVNANGGMDGYSINPANGSLTPLAGSPFSITPPNGLSAADVEAPVVSPSGEYIYVSASSVHGAAAPAIIALSINPITGQLTQTSINSYGTAGVDSPTGLAIDPQGRFLYVADLTAKAVHVLSINSANGSVTEVAGSPFALVTVLSIQPWAVVTHPSGKFVYVLENQHGYVFGFSVDANSGTLTAVPGSPFAAGGLVMTLDQTGTFLFGGGHGGLSVSKVDQNTGALSQSFSVENNQVYYFETLAVDPSNKYLAAGFATENYYDGILTYALDSTSGKLTQLFSQDSFTDNRGSAFLPGTAPVSYSPDFGYVANRADNDLWLYAANNPAGSLKPLPSSPLTGFQAPAAVATDSLGKFTFTVDQNGIRVYFINPSTGALSLAVGSPYAVGSNPVAIAVDPFNRSVYVANKGSNNISAFSLNYSNGTLTSLGSVATGTAPTSLAIDPAGLVLLATNSGSGNVIAYNIAGNGSLSAGYDATIAAGTTPYGVAIDASSSYAFVVNQGSNNISVYSLWVAPVLQYSPGAYLTLLTTVALPANVVNPSAITLDPSGRFVYIAAGPAGTAGTLTAYQLNPASGSLTEIAGSPYPVDFDPVSVLTDPSGAWLYVVNSNSNNVSVFSINAATGALSSAAGTVYGTGSKPSGLAVSPAIK
jgi:YD repeat-containing protein